MRPSSALTKPSTDGRAWLESRAMAETLPRMFLTRWSSSAISRRWRSSLRLRSVMSRTVPITRTAAALLVRDGLAAVEQPARLPVRPDHLELELATAGARRVAVDVLRAPCRDGRDARRQAPAPGSAARPLDADEPPQIRRPVHLAGGRLVVVGAEPRGLARQPQPLVALAQLGGRRLELGGPLRDALLELAVEPLELPRLAVELGEDLAPWRAGSPARPAPARSRRRRSRSRAGGRGRSGGPPRRR